VRGSRTGRRGGRRVRPGSSFRKPRLARKRVKVRHAEVARACEAGASRSFARLPCARSRDSRVKHDAASLPLGAIQRISRFDSEAVGFHRARAQMPSPPVR
jgi:hypothetical protein